MRRFFLLGIFFQAISLTCSIFSMEQEEHESNASVSRGVTSSKDPENPNKIEITLTPEMYESANALIERIDSQLGSFVIQTFREHLFFIPEAFTTQESQDWYVKTLIDLTRAYGFDRLVNPVLMQELNMDTSSTIIFNPFITILNEIYTSELRADEVERLFSFCDAFMKGPEIMTRLASVTSSEEDNNTTICAFHEKKAQEKNRIGSLKNLMITTDIGFKYLGYKNLAEADTANPFAVRLSKIKTSVISISWLLEKLSTLQTITLRNQYLNALPES